MWDEVVFLRWIPWGLFPALLVFDILEARCLNVDELLDICRANCALAIRLETSNSMASISKAGCWTGAWPIVDWYILSSMG